jgi:hypothetical protein
MWTQGVEQDAYCPILQTQSTFPLAWTYLGLGLSILHSFRFALELLPEWKGTIVSSR